MCLTRSLRITRIYHSTVCSAVDSIFYGGELAVKFLQRAAMLALQALY